MGIMNFLFGKTDKKSSTLNTILSELYAAGTRAGVAVNAQTALECDTAFCCARVIAEGLAQVPFRRYQKTDTRRSVLDNNPVDAPNEWQTSFELREVMGYHLAFCGNFFAYLSRVNGKIAEILPYEPGMVTVKRDGWVTSYEVTSNGKLMQIPAADMWHIKGPSWNTWMGLDGVKLARESIGLSLAAEEYGSRFFGNNAMPNGILYTDGDPGPDKRKEIRDSWYASQSGESKLKTAVLWGGLKWMSTAIPNDNAQFLETRKHQVESICRMFRVNPIMVFYSDKIATYASAEQMFISHVVHTMSPWYSRIENSANKNLLNRAERERGEYFKFIANGLMRGAAKDRSEFYSKMYGIGAMSPNEIRDLEDMDPYEGGEKYRVPLNMTDPSAEESEAVDGQV